MDSRDIQRQLMMLVSNALVHIRAPCVICRQNISVVDGSFTRAPGHDWKPFLRQIRKQKELQKDTRKSVRSLELARCQA